MDANTFLKHEAQRIQASGILGEAKMRRLFEYLVTTSLAGGSPKEITIAIAVFDKSTDFDVGHDALVRVYMHKLRKTLVKYYGDRSDSNLPSLHIPRGEYRLNVNGAVAIPDAEPPPAAPLQPPPASANFSPVITRQGWIQTAALIGVGGLLGLLVATAVSRWRSSDSNLGQVRADPLWSTILADNRPILIVVGDYYLIGETDDTMEIKRLIREYNVNNKNDLDLFLNQHPEDAERYIDVGLRYLPTSLAFALRDIMPALDAGKRRINLALASDLTPPALKSMDIIYIGYVSGLGILQQSVFAGSRLAIGQSYDELVDSQTKHTYISQTAAQAIELQQGSGQEPSYRDYGMLASIRGPEGNVILVIAGTRDEGVRQTAEAATDPIKLREIRQRVDTGKPFEALMEVSALNGVNLSGEILFEAKR
jgi:hypothetical protein